ncbi:DNA polymerase epsilon subunit 3 [Dinochytrium kinnereticum]|nr:DNA polymerase epsilon subunit 3 [Dinochytrium kinnereticum]
MAVMHSAVTGRGGGSIPKLFDTTIKALEVAESSPPPEAPKPPTPPTMPKTGLSSIPNLSAAVSPSGSPGTQEALAMERLTSARENLDTLAALVATTLFHIQYAVGGDALTAFLAIHALRPSTTEAERRLVHKAMGVLKFAQYSIYILHESVSSEGIEFGVGTLVNLAGLGLGVAASIHWCPIDNSLKMASIDDLGMPKAITARVIKNALPPQGQCQKDAKAAMTRACANEYTKQGNLKTISTANIYEALRSNGFEEFIPKLKRDMEAYTQSMKEKKNLKRKSVDGMRIDDDILPAEDSHDVPFTDHNT